MYPLNISAEGTYTGQDLPAGDAQVTIETDSVAGSKPAAAYQGRKVAMSPLPYPEKAVALEAVKIPEKYKNKNRSGLKVTLEAGSQTKNFDLTD